MKDFLYRFFKGRYGAYGTDKLTKFLLILAVFLLVLSFLTPVEILYYFAFALLLYCYFRIFSKNIPARYKENELFVKVLDRIVNFFRGIGCNFSQRKVYHIYKCPNCKQKIRIPKGKGKIAVKCPKCGHEFIRHS